MSGLYRRVGLVHGKQYVVCWLPCENYKEVQLKPGLKMTLEGDDSTLWTVTKVYPFVSIKGQLEKKWKVGGLT